MKKTLPLLPLFLGALTSGVLSGCFGFDAPPCGCRQTQGQRVVQRSEGMQGVFKASPSGSQTYRGKNPENSRNTTLSNP